jgi:hypothetical protein
VYTFTASVTGPHVVELWGGGAGGATDVGLPVPGRAGGGGGGAYARSVLPLVAGTDYSVTVGYGGPGGGMDGFNGGESLFDGRRVVAAAGTGLPIFFPGNGGRVDFSTGDFLRRGGNGWRAPGLTIGGGGGGGASYFSQGSDASGHAGGLPIPDGGRGGDGEPPPLPTDGSHPGGGGGGTPTVLLAPGNGSPGRAKITWAVECP